MKKETQKFRALGNACFGLDSIPLMKSDFAVSHQHPTGSVNHPGFFVTGKKRSKSQKK
jgi:hypothetical protein